MADNKETPVVSEASVVEKATTEKADAVKTEEQATAIEDMDQVTKLPLKLPKTYNDGPLSNDVYNIIKDAELTRFPQGEAIKASVLWATEPTLVFVVRRAGCQFCRAQARLIGHTRNMFRQLGINVVAVMNGPDKDIEEFARTAWQGNVYLDNSKSFIRALGGGKPRIDTFWRALTPKFIKQLALNLIQNVGGTINNGNGPYLGGMLLIRSGNEGIAYHQVERTLGDYGKLDQILHEAHSLSSHKDEIDEADINELIVATQKRMRSSLTLCTDVCGI